MTESERCQVGLESGVALTQTLVAPFHRIRWWPAAGRRQPGQRAGVTRLAPLGQLRGVQPLPAQHRTPPARWAASYSATIASL